MLFGESGSGKTLFLYNLKSSINTFGVKYYSKNQDIEPTEGFNYEEASINNRDYGLFDLSGDPSQYQLIDVITKFVDIVGIIFFFKIDNIHNIENSKKLLRLVLNNQYLKTGISLFIIYNKKTQDNDKYIWITQDLLNKKLNIDELKKIYNLNFVGSEFFDCAICYNSFDIENILTKMEKFASALK